MRTTALASARDWNYRIASGGSGDKALDADFKNYHQRASYGAKERTVCPTEHGISSVGSFVAEKNGEHHAIPARDLAVVAFMVFPLERLHEAAERVHFEDGDVVEDALPPVGRYRF